MQGFSLHAAAAVTLAACSGSAELGPNSWAGRAMDTTTMARTKKSNKKRARKEWTGRAERQRDAPQALRLEVTRIRPYERNPRHSANPRVRSHQGLDSRHWPGPGVTRYAPAQVTMTISCRRGATADCRRSRSCTSVPAKSGSLWVDCLFVDWECESTVLLAHLRENELRGALSFIDRARAVAEIQPAGCSRTRSRASLRSPIGAFPQGTRLLRQPIP